MGGDVQGDSFI